MPDVKFKIIHDIAIKPNHDFVVVKVEDDDDEELRSGGIIVPHAALQNKKTMTGIVVAVGPGRISGNGEVLPMQCEVGERIIFATYIGYPVVLGEHGEHVIIKDYDAMGIVSEKSEYVDEVNPSEHIPDSQRQVQ